MCWCNNGLEIGENCENLKRLEPNPCMIMANNNVDDFLHALNLSPSVYVKCAEGNKPVLNVCQYPLVFSETLQECNWSSKV